MVKYILEKQRVDLFKADIIDEVDTCRAMGVSRKTALQNVKRIYDCTRAEYVHEFDAAILELNQQGFLSAEEAGKICCDF